MQERYTLRLLNRNISVPVSVLDDTIDYYDLTVSLTGNMHYIINGEDVILNADDAIIIPPGSRRIRREGSLPADYIALNFRTSEKIDLPLHIPKCAHRLRELLSMCHRELRKCESSYSAQKLQHILELILLTLCESVEKAARNPAVNKILDYINEHYTEHISLSDIAGSVYLTVPYCCSLIKQELETTIYGIILKKRILLAQEYILAGKHSLAEIPFLCGFSDYMYFSKCFKKETGVSPSKFIK